MQEEREHETETERARAAAGERTNPKPEAIDFVFADYFVCYRKIQFNKTAKYTQNHMDERTVLLCDHKIGFELEHNKNIIYSTAHE